MNQINKSVCELEKRVYISLPVKGETLSELLTRRLKNTVENTHTDSTLSSSLRSNDPIKSHLKDKLPKYTINCCVYYFDEVVRWGVSPREDASDFWVRSLGE